LMKLTTIAFFVCGLVIGGGGAYLLTSESQTSPAPQQASVPSRPLLTASALGRIQPAGGVISLGVSLPDQLARLAVEEGQEVGQGDVLAELGSQIGRAS